MPNIQIMKDGNEALERDCEITFYTAGGPGGQHRNKTQSAVRIVHLPTGITVTATERRSQFQNKQVALERLQERLEKLRHKPKKRVKTKPSRSSKIKRLEGKSKRSQIKAGRSQKNWD